MEDIKGPWKVEPYGDDFVVRDCKGYDVADVSPYGTEEAYLARATLLAAAPELLEALKQLRVPLKIQFDLHSRMCEAEGIDITISNAYQVAKSRIDIADAAIAKAEKPNV